MSTKLEDEDDSFDSEHEETVISYHSDEELSDSLSTDGALQYSLSFETPSTITGKNSPPNSVSTSVEHALATPSSHLMVRGHRSQEETEFIRTKMDMMAKNCNSEMERMVRGNHCNTASSHSPNELQFCQRCISVHHQNNSGLKQHTIHRDKVIFSHCGHIERLKLGALKLKMKAEVACAGSCRSFDTQLHNTYRAAQAALAAEAFVHHKIHDIGREEFSCRLNNHLLYKDSTNLLAEVVRVCARPQASPEVVWQALLRTYMMEKCGNGPRTK